MVRDITVMLFLLWALVACSGTAALPEEILGDWKMKAWTIDQSGSPIRGKMDFSFYSSGTYSVDYGSEREKGRFYVEGDRLYTTEEGQARKYVKIKKCTADSLILGMNRAGRLETVVLIKAE